MSPVQEVGQQCSLTAGTGEEPVCIHTYTHKSQYLIPEYSLYHTTSGSLTCTMYVHVHIF